MNADDNPLNPHARHGKLILHVSDVPGFSVIIKSKKCDDCGHITGLFNKSCIECGSTDLVVYYNHV